MKESPLFWPVQLKGNHLLVLDETLLPFKKKYICVKSVKQAVAVIKTMKTRAFGQFLVVLNTFLLVLLKNEKISDAKLLGEIRKCAGALNASRPTFPFGEVTSIVVGWAEQAKARGIDMRSFLKININGFLFGIRQKRLGRVYKITSLIKDGDSVLTHCNVSGELAMAARILKEQKKRVHFFATETRPYFQGAKLTCWELKQVGVPVTLVADNAVGTLLSDGLVDLVIVGSDRSCANGDIANKIGTYQIAVLAKEFKIPFYVLTQSSKKIKKGQDIPIEIRDAKELLCLNGRRVVPKGVGGFYPGFDVVPSKLITRSLEVSPR